jgi:hypothetical protein
VWVVTPHTDLLVIALKGGDPHGRLMRIVVVEIFGRADSLFTASMHGNVEKCKDTPI